MILRRLAANLRAQNWTTVAIELAIVIIGVFIGIEAANWNQQRQQRNETRVLLSQLQVELAAFSNFLGGLDDYYAITRKYAAVAEAGWRREPDVSDKEFVIAAYQASQVTAVGNNSPVWAEIFGAGELRNLDDLELRQNLARLMTFNYEVVDLASVSTAYRQEVRKVIPDKLQDAIRSNCGDRPGPDGFSFRLPPTCEIPLAEAEFTQAAADLRSSPELRRELRWHQAAVANQLLNVGALQRIVQVLTSQIARI